MADAMFLSTMVERTVTISVLLLHLVHELTPKEVAEAIARPDATVRTQLARGLELLRKALPLGIAGFAAGQVPLPIGLATVRAAVLAHAAQALPVAATTVGAGSIVFTVGAEMTLPKPKE